ncbi:MAG: PepSY domain-containing protein [Nitrospira sp.]|nr:PepSY domain-containing protein [Nitrospira sp.]
MTVGKLKNWYLIHKWTSLICTIFLLLLCVTGLPLVFRDELAVLLGEAIEPPEAATTTVPVNLQAMVDDAQARLPKDHVQFLTLDDQHPAWFVSLAATLTSVENTGIFMYDSRTGAFLHAPPANEGVTNFFFKLHTELFAGLPGTLFLGAMGLLFVASVVSGVVVYGPFMRRLAFGTIRQRGSGRLTWLDLHNLLGIVTVLWALVVGVTGVINTLDRPLFAYWQETEVAGMIAPWTGKPTPNVLQPMDAVIKTAEAAAPDMVVRFVAFPGTLFASPHHFMVFMRGQTPLTARLLTPLLIDAETAQLTDARSLPWYLTALVLSQPLHFGDYGGTPFKIIWGLLGVITIVVLVSGLYLWWKKRHTSMDQFMAEAEPTNEVLLSVAQSATRR